MCVHIYANDSGCPHLGGEAISFAVSKQIVSVHGGDEKDKGAWKVWWACTCLLQLFPPFVCKPRPPCLWVDFFEFNSML